MSILTLIVISRHRLLFLPSLIYPQSLNGNQYKSRSFLYWTHTLYRSEGKKTNYPPVRLPECHKCKLARILFYYRYCHKRNILAENLLVLKAVRLRHYPAVHPMLRLVTRRLYEIVTPTIHRWILNP